MPKDLLHLKMEKLLMIILLSLIFLMSTAHASFDWRGHNRLIGTSTMGAGDDDDFESSKSEFVFNHRSELIWSKGFHGVEVAYELYGIHESYQNLLLKTSGDDLRFSHRVEDLNYFVVNDDAQKSYQRVIQNLDRLYYNFQGEKNSLKVGRQPISFGSARVINPLDILVPFSLVMINTEQQFGVDSIRFSHSFSEMGIFELGRAQDKLLDEGEQYQFLSVRETFVQTDVQLLYQSIYEYKVFGIDLQTNLAGWGVWVSGANFNSEENDSFIRSTIGGQYHFKNDFDCFMEYHYNGMDKLEAELGIFVNNKNYYNLGGSYLVSPLQSFSVSFINNLKDKSSLVNAGYQYNLAQDYYGEIGYYFGIGSEQSEFKQYPQVLFASLKHFF